MEKRRNCSLGAADEKLAISFFLFSQKTGFVRANCLISLQDNLHKISKLIFLRRQFSRNVNAYFLGKIRKHISEYHLLKFYPEC